MTAQGTANVAGTTDGTAEAKYGGAAPAFQSTDATVAYGVAAPSASASQAVLTAHPTIAGAFGPDPQIYSLGELGGGSGSLGAGAETSSSKIVVALNESDLSSGGTLYLGLYDGDTVNASHVTGISLTVTGNGANLLTTPINSTSAFHDTAVDLGALGTSGTLDLDLTLTVNTNAAGAGFYGDFILGDPPAAMSTVLHDNNPWLGADLASQSPIHGSLAPHT
jgi:hypothetical protein